MSNSDKKLVVSLQKISIRNEKNMETDVESVSLSDEDALLETSIVKVQPTNSDLMKFLEKMNENLASNNMFKATATKRLDDLDSKTDANAAKILQLESCIAELKSNGPHAQADGWSEQRKLNNNINIIGIHPSNGENLTNIVLDIYIFYGLSIAAADIESVYRVKYSKSNMIIVRFTKFDTKLKLLTAKKNKKLSVGDIPSVACSTGGAAKEIFINTHVTPFVGRLLHRGRIAVKEKALNSCWMSANCVLVKITSDGDPITVKSMSDFDRILGAQVSLLNEPSSMVVGKRRIEEISPTPTTDSQPKSKSRTNLRGRTSTGPLSSKLNKDRAASKQRNN